MNIHHLELFYYVARHGGISAAVRHMPYGIQQPAVSGQILLLEEDLGVKLFVRHPFKLTAPGRELMAFARPFFDHLDAVGARLREQAKPQLRVGASEMVLRDHLSAVMRQVKVAHPGLKLVLRSGFQSELESWLQADQIDLALLTLRGRPPAHAHVLPLVRLPLVLLVHRKSGIKSAAELWARDRIDEPLICLPPAEKVSLLFQNGLKRRGVDWPIATEASSLELITQYVADGHGVGVHVASTAAARHRQVRVLPLEGFEPVELVALWLGDLTPLVRMLLGEIQAYARRVWPEAACPDALPAAGGARSRPRRDQASERGAAAGPAAKRPA